jgi:hypothetical protein
MVYLVAVKGEKKNEIFGFPSKKQQVNYPASKMRGL